MIKIIEIGDGNFKIITKFESDVEEMRDFIKQSEQFDLVHSGDFKDEEGEWKDQWKFNIAIAPRREVDYDKESVKKVEFDIKSMCLTDRLSDEISVQRSALISFLIDLYNDNQVVMKYLQNTSRVCGDKINIRSRFDFLIEEKGLNGVLKIIAKSLPFDHSIDKFKTSDVFNSINFHLFSEKKWIMESFEDDKKNKFTDNGWLSKNGKFYPCGYMGHIQSATKLAQVMNDYNKSSPDETLLDNGWLKITQGNILCKTNILDNQKHIDFVFDFTQEKGKEIKVNNHPFSLLSK